MVRSARRRSRPDGGFRPLYAGSFVVYGDRFAIPPILFAIATDFQVSLAAATAVASSYFLFYGAMQFWYGVLSDRLGRVRVMRVALLGMGLANLGAAAAPTLSTLVIAKAIAAGCAAAVLPTSLVYVGDKVPFDRRQQVIASLLAAGGVGTVLASVGAGLLAGAGAWRVVFVIPAVIALVVAATLGRLPESLSGERGGGPVVQLGRVLSQPWAVFLVALAVVEGVAMLGFLTFLAPALQAHGVSAGVAGLVVATYGVSVAGGMQLLKRSLRRTALTPAGLIALGGALLVVGYLTAAQDQAVGNILVASVLVGLAFCFLHSTLQTWATEVAPEARGTATSLFVTGVFSGAALGTAAVSGLADAQRYGTLFLVAAAVALPVTVVGSLARARYATSTRAPV